MNRLFIFDMDGTLIPNTTASIEISRVTKTQEKLLALEEKFASGIIDTKEFAVAIYKLWGYLDDKIVKKAFENANKIKNIDKVIENISKLGNKSCIITMSPDFFADFFWDYGFDYIYASRFPKNHQESFDTSGILCPEDKRIIAIELCQKLGFQFEESVAFGDSMSDFYIFNELKYTVSVNGNNNLCRFSRYHYEGTDLMEAYSLLEL